MLSICCALMLRTCREPGLVLFIFLVGLAYSVVAPILLPCALAYFVTGWLLWRTQLLYSCERVYESGGRMWPIYFDCLMACLATGIATTGASLLFKQANAQVRTGR
jgi:Calcium-dependent channel, 7TM region, putative phosphate